MGAGCGQRCRELGIQEAERELKGPSLHPMSSASLRDSQRCPAVCVHARLGFKAHSLTQFALTQHLSKGMEVAGRGLASLPCDKLRQ